MTQLHKSDSGEVVGKERSKHKSFPCLGLNSPIWHSIVINHHNGQANCWFQGPSPGLRLRYDSYSPDNAPETWNPALSWTFLADRLVVTKPTVEVLSKADVQVTVGTYTLC
jgi:hypothetical protein